MIRRGHFAACRGAVRRARRAEGELLAVVRPESGSGGRRAELFHSDREPGLRGLAAAVVATLQGATTTAGGTGTSGLFWRPLGAGGNPLTGEGKQDQRYSTATASRWT